MSEAAVTEIRPDGPVHINFNTAQAVVDDLGEQVARLSKDLAIAKAQIRERDEFIKANAAALGMVVAEDGTVSVPAPVPSRQQRRAAARTQAKTTNKTKEPSGAHH